MSDPVLPSPFSLVLCDSLILGFGVHGSGGFSRRMWELKLPLRPRGSGPHKTRRPPRNQASLLDAIGNVYRKVPGPVQ